MREGFCLLALVVLILGPFVGIWVINTLFDLNNPYDFTHWLAVFLAGFAFGGSGYTSKES